MIPYGTFLKFLRPGSRLPVAAVKQLLDVGRTVQYLAAQPGEGKQAAVTVLLQAAAAHFQLFSQFAVRIEVLARHRRWPAGKETLHGYGETLDGGEELSYMLAALTGEQTVIGVHHDLIFFCSTFVFHGLSDRPSHAFSPFAALLHYLDDAFHIPGLVICLVADLCVCQRAVFTQGLQGSRADLQQQAHLLVVQPFLFLHVTVQPAEGVQPVRERPEGREYRLEGPCLNVHYSIINVISGLTSVSFSFRIRIPCRNLVNPGGTS